MNNIVTWCVLVCALSFHIGNASAITFGISPNKITLANEEKIALINPNNQTVQFTIHGCNESIIEMPRSGSIAENDIRFITIRRHQSHSDEVQCTATVIFHNGGYATGASLEIILPDKNTLPSFAQPLPVIEEFDKKKSSSIPISIIIAGVLLIIALVIIKFVL
ncbi:MAG: hypothetical protein ACMXYE_03860 [Candidatus Woesearchaeota archaeon]